MDEMTAVETPARPGLFARFKAYLWDWRAVAAVAVATLIIGGLAGLSTGMAIGGGGGGHAQPGHHGGFNPWPGFRGGPPGR